MLKSELRKEFLHRRNCLSAIEVEDFSKEIFLNFLQHFHLKKGQKVHLFLSMTKFNEINTQPFIKHCFENKIRVFVPKIVDGSMESVEIFSHSEFKKNKWGIVEPIDNDFYTNYDFDFVLTPLLYCDAKGNRVGYGKGFYDEFFTALPKKTQNIGFNYYQPSYFIDDIREDDVALDYLVLPTEVLSFTAL